MSVSGEFLNRVSNDSKRFLNGYYRITGVERQLIYELTSDYLQHFSLIWLLRPKLLRYFRRCCMKKTRHGLIR